MRVVFCYVAIFRCLSSYYVITACVLLVCNRTTSFPIFPLTRAPVCLGVCGFMFSSLLVQVVLLCGHSRNTDTVLSKLAVPLFSVVGLAPFFVHLSSWNESRGRFLPGYMLPFDLGGRR